MPSRQNRIDLRRQRWLPARRCATSRPASVARPHNRTRSSRSAISAAKRAALAMSPLMHSGRTLRRVCATWRVAPWSRDGSLAGRPVTATRPVKAHRGGPLGWFPPLRRAVSRPPSCLTTQYKRTFVPMGDNNWRAGFEYAWQASDPEPDEGPGSPGGNSPPPLVRLVEREAPRNHHRRSRRLARIRAPREPARPVADHHRRPLRHRRGGAGGDRRGVGRPGDGRRYRSGSSGAA